MTDPSEALASFQAAHSAGRINLQSGSLDPSIFVHLDNPSGTPRFTYVRLNGTTVTALVMLVMVEPLQGIPCFQIGYAVPVQFRSQGRAKDAVRSAIKELWNGMSRNGLKEMYIEAIVSDDNEASQRVAAATLSADSVEVTDFYSGASAKQYLGKIGF